MVHGVARAALTGEIEATKGRLEAEQQNLEKVKVRFTRALEAKKADFALQLQRKDEEVLMWRNTLHLMKPTAAPAPPRAVSGGLNFSGAVRATFRYHFVAFGNSGPAAPQRTGELSAVPQRNAELSRNIILQSVSTDLSKKRDKFSE